MRTTYANLYESWLHWVALWLLVLAVQDATQMMTYLVDEPAQSAFESAAEVATFVATAVLLLAALLFLLRQSRMLWSVTGPADLKRRSQWRADSYTIELVKRSALIASFVAFAVFSVIDPPGLDSDFDLPGDFFVKLATFLLTASYSISFFAFSLRGAGDEDVGNEEE
jgi:hypothetical protein